MNRMGVALLAGGAVLGMAACGSAAAGGSSASPSPGGGGRGLARNGAAGQLVQINGMTLILSGANGDTSVTYSGTTVISQTSTGTVADIVAGTCIIATGQKDSSGALTAASVRLSDAVNGACPAGRGPGGIGGPPPGISPGATFSPPPGAANFSGVRGQVTPAGVTGTSVSVQQTNGTVVTITVPTTVRVSKSSVVQPSVLATGQCVAAQGTKDASGNVTARALTIVPAGPSGCFTGGAGGGGFGGGGGGFGGGGGGGVGGGGGGAVVGPIGAAV